jgi:hypothetical protein
MTDTGISRTRLPDSLSERLDALDRLLPPKTRTLLSGTHPLSFLLFDRGVDLWEARWENQAFLVAEAGGHSFLPAPPSWTLASGNSGALEHPLFWNICARSLASWNNGLAGRLDGLPLGFGVPGYPLPRRTEIDYLLDRTGWVPLEGRSFRAMRWERNRLFRLRPDVRAIPWDNACLSDAKNLLDLFFSNRRERTKDPYALALLDDQRTAHEKALTHWDTLGLEGWTLVSGQRLIGIEWYATGSGDAVCFLEARNPDFTGIPVVLTRFYFEAHPDCRWINIQGSAGVPSLERAKSLDCPALSVPVHSQDLPPDMP